MRSACTFALTRGYRGFSRIRYSIIILRNWSIFFALRRYQKLDAHILFHEGNISRVDQWLIQFASPIRLSFVDISEDFQVPQGFERPAEESLGYALMCRFQALTVFGLLEGFDTVMRLDEDCFIYRCPDPFKVKGFVTAALEPESHDKTNDTLPSKIKSMGLDSSVYDHKFPYTNFYIAEVSPWMKSEVRSFVSELMSEPKSLVWRWGDIPVLGVTLNTFPMILGPAKVDPQVRYFHLSHLAKVKNSSSHYTGQSLDARKPIRSSLRLLRALFSRKREG